MPLFIQVHHTSTAIKRLKTMAKRSQKNEEVVVVVGGGAAAQEAVESMRNRQDPFTGDTDSILKGWRLMLWINCCMLMTLLSVAFEFFSDLFASTCKA